MLNLIPGILNLPGLFPPLEAGVIGSINFKLLLVRTCSPQPLLARLWRILGYFTLARGEKNSGFGQNVLTSNYYFLEPITPALEGVRGRNFRESSCFPPPDPLCYTFLSPTKTIPERGRNLGNSLNPVQNFNTLKLAKLELNSPALEGERLSAYFKFGAKNKYCISLEEQVIIPVANKGNLIIQKNQSLSDIFFCSLKLLIFLGLSPLWNRIDWFYFKENSTSILYINSKVWTRSLPLWSSEPSLGKKKNCLGGGKLAVFLLFFLLPVSKNLAQTLDTILQIPAVEITSPRLQSFKTGIKQQQFDAFQKLSVQTEDLGTALTLNTPIFIKNYGPGRLATTSIRGASAAQTAVLWNGFKMNNPMLGQTDFSLIPTFFMDEIGVQYGSNSTAWGSGAIGGSIILQNKNQYNQGWQGTWQSKTGSFDNFFNGLGIGYSDAQFSSTTKVFYQSAQNDFPIKNGQSKRLPHANFYKWGLFHKDGFKIKDNQQLDLAIWYQDAERNIPSNLLQSRSVAVQEDEYIRTSVNWKYIGNLSIVQIRSALFYDRLFFQDSIAQLDSRSRTWTNQNEIEWTRKITKHQSVNIGLNYAYLKANSTGYDAMNPNQNRTGVFASYHWKNSRQNWNAQLSIRQEWVDGAATPFIPSLGVEGQLLDVLKLTATVSKSYRVPTFNDLFWEFQGNQSLLPENGWNQELGLAYKPNNTWKISNTAYNRTIRNWILWQPENGIWRPNNLSKVWSRGVENNIEWQRNIQELKLKLSIQYNLTFSTNQEGNDATIGKQLIYVPKHQLNANFRAIWKDWTITFYHQYTGKVYTLTDNSSTLPAYHLDHVFLYRNWTYKNIKGNAFIKLNNIFGINYQVIAQFPMPQRNLEIGWNIGF